MYSYMPRTTLYLEHLRIENLLILRGKRETLPFPSLVGPGTTSAGQGTYGKSFLIRELWQPSLCGA